MKRTLNNLLTGYAVVVGTWRAVKIALEEARR